MHVAQRETFEKAVAYGLKHIKIELINQDNMECSQYSVKKHVVNFGNSIFDNSNWDKISEDIIKQS